MTGGANWEAQWAWNGESGQRWAVDADRRDRFTARVGDALLADAQTHDFRPGIHDVVVSRFGTMFFDDPTAAFINLSAALRPGGRLCIATWQPLVANDWLAVPGAVLSGYGHFPDTGGGGPGMFAQSDPEVVRATLQHAGFEAVDVAEVAVTVRLGDDPSDAADYLAGTGPGRAVLDTIPEDERTDALTAVAATLRDHRTDDGVHLGAGILVTTALRP